MRSEGVSCLSHSYPYHSRRRQERGAARALRDGRHQKIGKDIICQRIRSLPSLILILSSGVSRSSLHSLRSLRDGTDRMNVSEEEPDRE